MLAKVVQYTHTCTLFSLFIILLLKTSIKPITHGHNVLKNLSYAIDFISYLLIPCKDFF